MSSTPGLGGQRTKHCDIIPIRLRKAVILRMQLILLTVNFWPIFRKIGKLIDIHGDNSSAPFPEVQTGGEEEVAEKEN